MKVAARIEKDGQVIGKIMVDFSIEWVGEGKKASAGWDKVIEKYIDPDGFRYGACGVITSQVYELSALLKDKPVHVIPLLEIDYGSTQDAFL